MRNDTATNYREICVAFTAWLEDNYRRGDVALNDFVKTTQFSRRHVQRAFASGRFSWRAALIQKRMEEGARLLVANPAITVGQIAASVGYSQPAQFSRTFREVKGKSPLEYRKNGGEDGN